MNTRRIRFFVLESPEGPPIEEADPFAWADWVVRATGLRTVAKDVVDGLAVWTVFVGLDERKSWEDGPPLLWETRAGGPFGSEAERKYATRAEAALGHKAILAELAARCGARSPGLARDLAAIDDDGE